MAYRIDLRKNLGRELVRIGLDQIETCRVRFAAADPGDGGAHDVRKSLKRLRALLALAGPAIGKAKERHERHRFRDLGRILAASRDAAVMRGTLRKVEHQYGLGSSGPTATLANLLQTTTPPALSPVQIRRVTAGLERATAAMSRLDVSTLSKADLLGAAVTTYGKARRGLRRLERDDDDEAVHAWRKCVQTHWRQMRLLAGIWPDEIDVRIRTARKLSQLLGDHHDLTLLRAFMRESAQGSVSKAERQAIAQFIAISQKQLLRSAIPLGTILFAEAKSSFAKRLAVYWSSSRKLRDKTVVPAARPRADRPKLVKPGG